MFKLFCCTQPNMYSADIATGYSLVYTQEDLFIIMAQSSGKHDAVKLQHILLSNETNQEAK